MFCIKLVTTKTCASKLSKINIILSNMTEMLYFIPFQGLCHLECAAFALKQLHYVKHCLKYDHLSITAMDISGSEMCHSHLFLL